MLTKELIEKRLDELLKEAENLLEEIPPIKEIEALHQEKEYIIHFNKWKLSCLNFLRSAFGPNHYFLDNFKKSMSGYETSAILGETEKHTVSQPIYYSNEQVSKGYSVLIFIKEQIDLGLVNDAQHLYEASLFSNLIEQAFELLKNGYKHAAAIYGRLVIENTIKDLCRLNNIEIKDKKLSDMLFELRKLNVIDLPKERVIQSKYDIGSLAAHGKVDFDKYSNRDIEELLEFVRDKIVTIE